MTKNRTIKTLDVLKTIRKPAIPKGHVMSTAKGKRGYNRKDNRRLEREYDV